MSEKDHEKVVAENKRLRDALEKPIAFVITAICKRCKRDYQDDEEPDCANCPVLHHNVRSVFEEYELKEKPCTPS